MLPTTEDAASVLEHFILDVANLPAEIAHLYEEAAAKQDAINNCNVVIAAKDGQLQRFVKTSGALARHPREEQLVKEVNDAYARAVRLQDDKVALVQRACALLDRYVKRLDVKIRDLQAEGSMPLDNRMPSLLRASDGNLVAADSRASSTGTHTPIPSAASAPGGPLQPVTGNYAQSALSRLSVATAGARASTGASTPHPLAQAQSANAPSGSTTAGNKTADAAARTREQSASATDGGMPAKKRRMHPGSIAMPPSAMSGSTTTGGGAPSAAGAAVRQSSQGPGTPKPAHGASTPGGSTSRAGSVGPGARAATSKKGLLPPRKSGPHGPLAQQLSRKKLGIAGPHKAVTKKAGRRVLGSGGARASPSTTAENSSGEESGEEDGSYAGEGKRPKSRGGAGGDADMDEGSDDTKYCYCHDVSHGDMIACDNADCRIQWFHWQCAGITQEPQGEWLCNDCRKLPREKIKKNE